MIVCEDADCPLDNSLEHDRQFVWATSLPQPNVLKIKKKRGRENITDEPRCSQSGSQIPKLEIFNGYS